jgi:hypothetical protein
LRQRRTADATARIDTLTATMVAVPIADTMEAKRLTEFASDVARLADERQDTEAAHPRR